AQSLPAQNIINVAYGSDAAQKMDVYLPAGRNADSTKVIIMVHGGAWSAGDKNDFNSYVPVLQQRLPGYAVVNINYRLASGTANPFPAQETDMKAALEFIIQKGSEYGISQKFVLLGASAGAHMSLLQAYKYATPKIRAVVDFFGPTDMAALYSNASLPTLQFALQLLMSGTPSTNQPLYFQSSPINFVTAQSPPTIILHGSADVVVPISQSVLLNQKLQSLGVTSQFVEYTGFGHDVWPPATMTDAFNKIEAFIKANVN
ncbi:MAG: alpha/beta hydrolase, partial [Bacteroidota bacterium]